MYFGNGLVTEFKYAYNAIGPNIVDEGVIQIHAHTLVIPWSHCGIFLAKTMCVTKKICRENAISKDAWRIMGSYALGICRGPQMQMQ